ncbi:hypothetical protein B0T17DRAFT_436 [Bombardia bombarda]|uniref:Uncharacterized protein n=1 Tax=Bombardia bombarda TaxID=252184 RepID=A0AA39XJL6_9PEZI|nr:hypothetical protein B0T17DRAFT_436 [Bombardia bombarda]
MSTSSAIAELTKSWACLFWRIVLVFRQGWVLTTNGLGLHPVPSHRECGGRQCGEAGKGNYWWCFSCFLMSPWDARERPRLATRLVLWRYSAESSGV